MGEVVIMSGPPSKGDKKSPPFGKKEPAEETSEGEEGAEGESAYDVMKDEALSGMAEALGLDESKKAAFGEALSSYLQACKK